jgi:GTP-binding protein Era
MAHKAGFVNILGKPNAGKSTLMNALIGEKLSIITPKAQTTRHRIMGLANGEDFQIVYSDTPGILKPHYKLQESMMRNVESAMLDADIFIYICEANESPESNEILDKLRKTEVPVILLINKIDLSDQSAVEKKMAAWQALLPKAEIIPVSALLKFNLEKVLQSIMDHLPESPPYFPKDEISDKTMRFFISEIIREKILKHYHKEVPYSTEVIVEEYKEEEKIIRIRALIFVTRESQKAIILGHQGSSIKRVGTDARKDIEEFVNKKVYLELFVKVSKDWRNDERQLKRFGYE